MEIPTIAYKAWQVKPFPVLKALELLVIDILSERLKAGTLEYYNGPYRNSWFLVKKLEPGKYRIVNTTMLINQVIIRDANLPPYYGEFAAEFARY